MSEVKFLSEEEALHSNRSKRVPPRARPTIDFQYLQIKAQLANLNIKEKGRSPEDKDFKEFFFNLECCNGYVYQKGGYFDENPENELDSPLVGSVVHGASGYDKAHMSNLH